MRKILHVGNDCWICCRHLWTHAYRFTDKHVISRSQCWYHLVVSIATVIAGIWTYHIFIAERHDQSHLSIEVESTISTNAIVPEGRKLVFLDVELANTGKRKLEVKRVPKNQIAYQDPAEVIKYGCGISVRKIRSSLISTNMSLDWFNAYPAYLECPPGIPVEISLLSEYEIVDPSNPARDGIDDFWIEPGDKYHFGTPLILGMGDYLLKVHFIGNNSDNDFWSRILYLHVN